jgi:hypothetical protein
VREAAGEEAVEATEHAAHEQGTPFIARLDRESRAQEQGGVELVVTTRRLHFFDPATGRGIYDGDSGQS